MKAFARFGAACALSLCIAGCAAPGPPTVPTAKVTPLRTKEIPADRVGDAVAVGKSTKADVIAALGETLVISFDSGYEVWVYRLGGTGSERRARPGAAGEFVVLFAPSGLVAKTRIRPAQSQSSL